MGLLVDDVAEDAPEGADVGARYAVGGVVGIDAFGGDVAVSFAQGEALDDGAFGGLDHVDVAAADVVDAGETGGEDAASGRPCAPRAVPTAWSSPPPSRSSATT